MASTVPVLCRRSSFLVPSTVPGRGRQRGCRAIIKVPSSSKAQDSQQCSITYSIIWETCSHQKFIRRRERWKISASVFESRVNPLLANWRMTTSAFIAILCVPTLRTVSLLNSVGQRRVSAIMSSFASSSSSSSSSSSPSAQYGLRLVLISDTHEFHHKHMDTSTTTDQQQLQLPAGDVLIHCGDFTNSGDEQKMQRFLTWFTSQPHLHKIFIAGNHDMTLDPEFMRTNSRSPQRFNSQRCRDLVETISGAVYLQDSATTVMHPSNCGRSTTTFYGAPWQPAFWGAFNLPRGGQALQDKWNAIPADIDVLLTHTPPHGILDYVPSAAEHVGCELLRTAVNARVRPRVHVFGHIHECGGQSHFHEFAGVGSEVGEGSNCKMSSSSSSSGGSCNGGRGSDNSSGGGSSSGSSSSSGSGSGSGSSSGGVTVDTPPRRSCLFVNAASCSINVAGPLHKPVVVFLPFDRSLPASIVVDSS